jgi:FkbM family methyltransferase
MSNVIKKIINKVNYLYKLHILRDTHLRNVRQWYLDKADEKLKLNYPLDHLSIAFDIGGYLGNCAFDINQKFNCRVYLFEPVPGFYQECVRRFANNPSIICLNYGLASRSGRLGINVDENSSSFSKKTGTNMQQVQVRSIDEVIAELGVEKIDFIEMNIEGGEFDLLPAMIDSGLIKQVRYLKIQFHDFVENAVENRQRIRNSLRKTHREMWNYEFVWESWELL